jgi:hypothetical protein
MLNEQTISDTPISAAPLGGDVRGFSSQGPANPAARVQPLNPARAALSSIEPGPGLSLRQQLHERWKAAQFRMMQNQSPAFAPCRRARIVYAAPIGPKPKLTARLVYLLPIGPSRMLAVGRGAHVRAIKADCVRRYGFSEAELLSQRRQGPLVLARQICMYRLFKEVPKASLPGVGRWMGGRDHTTVLHAVRKITALIESGELEL